MISTSVRAAHVRLVSLSGIRRRQRASCADPCRAGRRDRPAGLVRARRRPEPSWRRRVPASALSTAAEPSVTRRVPPARRYCATHVRFTRPPLPRRSRKPKPLSSVSHSMCSSLPSGMVVREDTELAVSFVAMKALGKQWGSTRTVFPGLCSHSIAEIMRQPAQNKVRGASRLFMAKSGVCCYADGSLETSIIAAFSHHPLPQDQSGNHRGSAAPPQSRAFRDRRKSRRRGPAGFTRSSTTASAFSRGGTPKGVRLFTRNGYDFTARFPKIVEAVGSLGVRHA